MPACLCTICPHCRSGQAVHHESVFRAKWLAPLGWFRCWCSICGSRWGAWHWLEQRTGLTWRRLSVHAPGILTPAEVGSLVELRARVRHGEVAR